MHYWTGDMKEEKQLAYKSMREVEGGRVRRNSQMYKPLTQNIQVGCLVWYFDPGVLPGTSHNLRSIWTGLYHVTKVIAPTLAEIKPVYYPAKKFW